MSELGTNQPGETVEFSYNCSVDPRHGSEAFLAVVSKFVETEKDILRDDIARFVQPFTDRGAAIDLSKNVDDIKNQIRLLRGFDLSERTKTVTRVANEGKVSNSKYEELKELLEEELSTTQIDLDSIDLPSGDKLATEIFEALSEDLRRTIQGVDLYLKDLRAFNPPVSMEKETREEAARASNVSKKGKKGKYRRPKRNNKATAHSQGSGVAASTSNQERNTEQLLHRLQGSRWEGCTTMAAFMDAVDSFHDQLSAEESTAEEVNPSAKDTAPKQASSRGRWNIQFGSLAMEDHLRYEA